MKPTSLKIIQTLNSKGFTAYWAGGCVRDLLLKKEPQDIDIATDATPDQIESIFKKTYPIGKQFGVILIEEDGHHFEIATFRNDSGDSDGRRPDAVYFSSAEEDALRRDFTINGIFYDPIDERFYDFVGGQPDLKRGILRFIGDPETRMREDYLRILRAVRFKNRFKLVYGPKVTVALKNHASLVLGIAAERITEELNKIIVHKYRKQALLDLDQFGILEKIMPELTVLKNIQQPKDHHSEGDVFTHSLCVLDKLLVGENLAVYWAALFHDLGKAQTAVSKDGIIHFPQHYKVSIDLAKKIIDRLRFSTDQQRKIYWLIKHHHIFDQFDQMSQHTKLHYFDHAYFPDLITLHRADLLGSMPYDFSDRLITEEDLNKIINEWKNAKIKKMLPSQVPDFFTGQEIMQQLNIPAGPLVGRLKSQLREKQLNGGIVDKDEALSFLRKLNN